MYVQDIIALTVMTLNKYESSISIKTKEEGDFLRITLSCCRSTTSFSVHIAWDEYLVRLTLRNAIRSLIRNIEQSRVHHIHTTITVP